MIGLGGGSLAKCNRHLPSTHLTVVEIDANVIALQRISDSSDGTDLRVITATKPAMSQPGRFRGISDVLLVDAYDRNGISRSVQHLSSSSTPPHTR
jgi:spermidine synthase